MAIAAGLGGEVGDAQMLADRQIGTRRDPARACRVVSAISVIGRRQPQHIERGDIGGKIGRNAALGKPARLTSELGLAAGPAATSAIAGPQRRQTPR